MVIDTADPVTITGLGGRYPKSWDVDEFWYNLMTGSQLCTESDERWPVGKFYPALTFIQSFLRTIILTILSRLHELTCKSRKDSRYIQV